MKNLTIQRGKIEEELVNSFTTCNGKVICKIIEKEPGDIGFEEYAKNWAIRGLVRAGLIQGYVLK